MMTSSLRLLAGGALALLVSFNASHAATIIKLDLGGTGPDLNFSGGVFGKLETVDDNPAGLTGDQATAILFTGFLSSMSATTGSYTLKDAVATGSPTTLTGGIIRQDFANGNFKLYDSSNVLLLDVDLSTSVLFGKQSGAFFDITNGTVVGGAPAITSQLVSNSIGMSMTLTNISGGGLAIDNTNNLLKSFFADATKEISATEIPEPGAILLALSCVSLLLLLRRR